MIVRHQHSCSVRSSQIRTLYVGVVFSVLCLYAVFTVYCSYFEIFRSVHSQINNHLLLHQPMYKVYSLQILIVFLLQFRRYIQHRKGEILCLLFNPYIVI